MNCRCGQPLTESIRDIGLHPEGGELVIVDEVSVLVCENCSYVVPSGEGLKRLYTALGADLEGPTPKARIFVKKT